MNFNEHFLNAIPLYLKEELVIHDRILVDFSTKEELWAVVLRVDCALDLLCAINAYLGGSTSSYRLSDTWQSSNKKGLGSGILPYLAAPSSQQ